MNLLCPSCQKMLTVPDQYAGQQMRCPMCNGIFTVPALPDASPPPMVPPPPPPPAPPPPPPPSPMTFPIKDDPMPPPAPPMFAPPGAEPSRAPAPPPVVRDYEKLRSVTLNPRVLLWVALGSIGLVFLMSFFPWFSLPVSTDALKKLASLTGREAPQTSFNPWSVGFGNSQPLFIFYDLFLIFGFLSAIALVLWTLKVIPEVPALTPWRMTIAGGFILSGFLMLFFYDLFLYMDEVAPQHTFWGMIAYWAHFVAAVSVALLIWLERRGPSAPMPRIDLHT